MPARRQPMLSMKKPKLSGGDKYKKYLKDSKLNSARRHKIKVGFFRESRYPNGIPVAQAADLNEFGYKHIPERPFFRRAISQMKTELAQSFLRNANQQTRGLDQGQLIQIGIEMAQKLEDSIREFKDPANAPSTVARKGFDDPLIDTKRMVNSIKIKPWSGKGGTAPSTPTR